MDVFEKNRDSILKYCFLMQYFRNKQKKFREESNKKPQNNNVEPYSNPVKEDEDKYSYSVFYIEKNYELYESCRLVDNQALVDVSLSFSTNNGGQTSLNKSLELLAPINRKYNYSIFGGSLLRTHSI